MHLIEPRGHSLHWIPKKILKFVFLKRTTPMMLSQNCCPEGVSSSNVKSKNAPETDSIKLKTLLRFKGQ